MSRDFRLGGALFAAACVPPIRLFGTVKLFEDSLEKFGIHAEIRPPQTCKIAGQIAEPQDRRIGEYTDCPGHAELKAFSLPARIADRAAAVAQSFFDPLPAGADVYMLKSVLADWPARCKVLS